MSKFTKLRIVSILILIGSQYSGYCQRTDTIQYQDYVIKYSKINFHINDTVIPFTLFIEPPTRGQAHYYFREGFVDSDSGDFRNKFISRIGKKDWVAFQKVFQQKTDSITNIQSYFPLLISHDSLFINNYPFDYNPFNFIYELDYSFILKNLLEPSLHYGDDKKAIRIIFPDEGIEFPGKYYSIRVEFDGDNATLTYSATDFDSNANFNLLEHVSCTLQGKRLLELEEAIGKIDFDEEHTFSVADGDEKFLVEYRIGNKYYALRKSRDYSFSGGRDKFMNLYVQLYSLARNCSAESINGANRRTNKTE